MVKLFRKYQRIILGVVAFMIIASFSFFGTYGAIESGAPKEKEEVVGKLLDGKPYTNLDLDRMSRFLDTDFYDIMNGDGRSGANLLNDGFVRNDIMKAGLAQFVFDANKDELLSELREKASKFKQFRPYVHPSKFLSFEGMLAQFAPNYHKNLIDFQRATEEKDAFSTLVKLYVDQTVFPAEMMRKMMLYVEHQYAKMAPPDPNLKSIDLSLFYAKSLSDWFGVKFLNKVSSFVLNCAAYASKQGYRVSLDEAKSLLLQIGAKHLKELEPNHVVTSDELSKFYKLQLNRLQMSEKEVLKTWQKILLVKKMLEDVGNTLFVDSLFYKQFSDYASKGAKIEVYKLPPSLNLKEEDDQKKLAVYLAAVSKNPKEGVLTKEFASLDEIKKRAPELLEKRFLVKLVSLKKESLISEISVRRAWDWQIDEENWPKLTRKFKELASCEAWDSDGRFSFIQTLDGALQEQIDAFARERIVEEDPTIIVEKLATLPLEERVLSITLSGDEEILPGVVDREKFLSLLERGNLDCYTENGSDYYHIEVVDSAAHVEVLTFAEAKQRGILTQLLESNKFKHLSFDKNPLEAYISEVKEKVIFGDESMCIDDAYPAKNAALLPKSPLENQWGVIKQEVRVDRKGGSEIFGDDLFSKEEGYFSNVISSEQGPLFYKVVETFVDRREIPKKMEEGRALLGKEAKELLVKELLTKIEQNGS